ncbi:MAG: desulfoferrodoxin [Nitrospirae bacterium]|nr:desulfoferrodoxin [Nitrospirota bacterium]
MPAPRILSAALLGALLAAAPAAAGPFDALQTETNAAHTPVITAPATVKAGEPFDVTVTIGATPHPSETGHFVRYIALYAGEVELARADLTPTLTRPRVTFTVVLEQPATLRALAAPNHAAAYVAEQAVAVTP